MLTFALPATSNLFIIVDAVAEAYHTISDATAGSTAIVFASNARVNCVDVVPGTSKYLPGYPGIIQYGYEDRYIQVYR